MAIEQKIIKCMKMERRDSCKEIWLEMFSHGVFLFVFSSSMLGLSIEVIQISKLSDGLFAMTGCGPGIRCNDFNQKNRCRDHTERERV